MDTRFDTIFEDYIDRITKTTDLRRLVVTSPCPFSYAEAPKDSVIFSYEKRDDPSALDAPLIYERPITLETHDEKVFHLSLKLFGFDANIVDINFQTSSLPRILSIRLQNKVINLRDYIVSMSLETRNASSFFFKTLNDGLNRFIKFEAASIFYHNYDQDWLALSATTGIYAIKDHDLKRSDIKYYDDSKSWVRKSFTRNEAFYEDDILEGNLHHNTYGESVRKIHNRLILPINVRPKIIRELETRYGRDSRNDGKIGVLRMLNIRRNGSYNHPSEIDLYIISHFAEYIAVLGRRYLQLIHADHVLEKATHGFTTDLSTLRLQQQLLSKQTKKFLEHLSSGDGSVNTHLRDRFREDSEIYDRDFTAIQDGMAFQLETVLDLAGGNIGGINLNSGTCEKPYVEAVKRVQEAAPSIAASYRRTGVKVTFGGQDNPDTDFIRIPSIDVPSEVLFLVLRNLVENSIKYTSRDRSPLIDINWSARQGMIDFFVQDNGMGIPRSDQNKLFGEGFRARHTLGVSTRGNGLGLFVSRKSVEQFGGKLDLHASTEEGSIFRISVPKMGETA